MRWCKITSEVQWQQCRVPLQTLVHRSSSWIAKMVPWWSRPSHRACAETKNTDPKISNTQQLSANEHHNNNKTQHKSIHHPRCVIAHSHMRFSDCSVVFLSKAWHTAAAPAAPISLPDDGRQSQGVRRQTTHTKHPRTIKSLKPIWTNHQSSKLKITTQNYTSQTLRCCKLTLEVKWLQCRVPLQSLAHRSSSRMAKTVSWWRRPVIGRAQTNNTDKTPSNNQKSEANMNKSSIIKTQNNNTKLYILNAALMQTHLKDQGTAVSCSSPKLGTPQQFQLRLYRCLMTEGSHRACADKQHRQNTLKQSKVCSQYEQILNH